MLKVDDVVQRLQSIHAVALDKTTLYINNMSMKEMNKLIDDALEMREVLKAQLPRLMTFEEIVTTVDECWFESANGAYGYADCYLCTGIQCVELHRIDRSPEYIPTEDFGKKWRCWTARPTDEQRKAVKWE